MFLQPLIIHPLDVGDSVNGTAVSVILVFLTESIVPVNLAQDFHKLLFGVGNVPEQFVVELQDTGPNLIRFPLIVQLDMIFQFLLGVLLLLLNFGQLCQDFGIERTRKIRARLLSAFSKSNSMILFLWALPGSPWVYPAQRPRQAASHDPPFITSRNIKVDVGSIDLIGIPHTRLFLQIGQQRITGHAIDADVHGLAQSVSGIHHTAL